MINFECSACGDCCRGLSADRRVVVFPNDVRPLADELNLDETSLAKKFFYLEQTKLSQSEMIDVYYIKPETNGNCPFLGKDNLCTVQNAKPEQCKRTPFGFAWAGARIHECMNETEIPAGYNTRQEDEQIFATLANGYRFKEGEQ